MPIMLSPKKPGEVTIHILEEILSRRSRMALRLETDPVLAEFVAGDGWDMVVMMKCSSCGADLRPIGCPRITVPLYAHNEKCPKCIALDKLSH